MAKCFATKARAAMTVLLAGSTLATAIPAYAQHYGGRHRDRHDGISAGDVIAGAIVIGGLAAILSSGNGNRGRNDRGYDPRYDGRNDRDYDRNYDGYDWNRNGGSREAIQRCVSAVERRGGRRNDVDVQRITNVDRIRHGYQIAGNVAVDYRGRDRDRYDNRDGYGRDGYGRDGYGRDGYGRDRNDNRGWDNDGRQRYDDRGRFTCTVRNGRVEDVDFRGI